MKNLKMSKQLNSSVKRTLKIFYLRFLEKLKQWGWKKITIEITAYSLLFIISFTFFINFYYSKKVEDKIFNAYEIEKLPEKEYAIVLGARLDSNNKASDILADRVQIGLNLLLSGKVKKLILSGANNEPKAMQEFIENKINKDIASHYISSGIIILDSKGTNTYNTCYSAKNNLNVNEAFVVTQEFHINRSVTTCRLLGIDAIGVKSDLKEYGNTFFYRIRDYFAFDKTIIDLKILKPKI